MSRSFLCSLLMAAAVPSCSAFMAQTTPDPTVRPASGASALCAVQSTGSRREVLASLATGLLGTAAAAASVAGVPSAAYANTVVDTDEFGQQVEYEEESGKDEPPPAPAPVPKSRMQ